MEPLISTRTLFGVCERIKHVLVISFTYTFVVLALSMYSRQTTDVDDVVSTKKRRDGFLSRPKAFGVSKSPSGMLSLRNAHRSSRKRGA